MISAYELALHIYEHRVAILFLIWLPGGHSRIAGISGPGKGSPGRGGRIVELHRVMICFAVPQGRRICGIRKEEGDLYAVGCPEVGIVAFPRKAIIIYRGSPADLSPGFIPFICCPGMVPVVQKGGVNVDGPYVVQADPYKLQ